MRHQKFVLGIAAVAVVLALFLLPVVPFSFGALCSGGLDCGYFPIHGWASVTYRLFSVGAVYISNPSGGYARSFCLVDDHPSAIVRICGIPTYG